MKYKNFKKSTIGVFLWGLFLVLPGFAVDYQVEKLEVSGPSNGVSLESTHQGLQDIQRTVIPTEWPSSNTIFFRLVPIVEDEGGRKHLLDPIPLTHPKGELFFSSAVKRDNHGVLRSPSGSSVERPSSSPATPLFTPISMDLSEKGLLPRRGSSAEILPPVRTPGGFGAPTFPLGEEELELRLITPLTSTSSASFPLSAPSSSQISPSNSAPSHLTLSPAENPATLMRRFEEFRQSIYAKAEEEEREMLEQAVTQRWVAKRLPQLWSSAASAINQKWKELKRDLHLIENSPSGEMIPPERSSGRFVFFHVH